MKETVASKVGGALPTRGGSAGEAQQMLSPVLHPLLIVLLLPQLEGGGKEMHGPETRTRIPRAVAWQTVLCCAGDSHGLLLPGSLQKGVPAFSFPNMGRYGPLLRPRCPVHRQAEMSPSLPWESPLCVLYRFPTTESHQNSWFSLTWFPPSPWLFCLKVFMGRRSLTSVPFRLLGRTLHLVSVVLFFQA